MRNFKAAGDGDKPPRGKQGGKKKGGKGYQ